MGKPKKPKHLAAAWVEPAWSALARRLGAASASAAVVISLLVDVPLLAAVGRGALTWISVLALFRLGGRALGSRPMGAPLDETEDSESASEAAPIPVRAPATRAT